MRTVQVASTLVESEFPDALAAVLGGSAAVGEQAATSDLDVVVFLEGDPAPFRERLCYRGWPVELFVLTPESFPRFVAEDVAARRSPLLHMCAGGVLITDRDGFGSQMQSEARAALAAGPPALSAEERDDRRYMITDLVDDMLDATAVDEQTFISARLLIAISELILLERREWLGQGKWLARRLREAAPPTATELIRGHGVMLGTGDPTMFVDAVLRALSESGGRLSEGYRRP